MKMTSLLPAEWKLYLLGAAVVVALAGVGYIYHKGSVAGSKAVIERSLTKAVKIREVQNEIRNARPDTDGLIDRLRSHDF